MIVMIVGSKVIQDVPALRAGELDCYSINLGDGFQWFCIRKLLLALVLEGRGRSSCSIDKVIYSLMLICLFCLFFVVVFVFV